jgi:hypothetical protein
MARRILAAVVGGIGGAGLAVPIATATGWSWLMNLMGIGGAVAAVAIAERRGLVETRDELDRPHTLFTSDRN